MDQQKKQIEARQEKLPYSTPELAVLGSVEALTQLTKIDPGGSVFPIIRAG